MSVTEPDQPLSADSPLRALAEQAPVMLWVSDPSGRCVMLNAGWRSFRGVASDGPLQDGWLHGIHQDDRATAERSFLDAHRERRSFTVEYRVRRGDGPFRWVHDHGTPWFDRSGAFMGQMGCCVDVTDQRSADWPMGNAEQPLRRLVESSQDLVYRLRLTPSPLMEYIGGAVEAITGRSAADFYADPFLPRRIVHPDDAHLMAMSPDEVPALPPRVTHRWIHPDGRIVWAENHWMPVMDGPQILAVEGIVRDVTPRIDVERRLRESEEQMRQLAARLQVAREEERTEVARELHDELGQTLTALKLEVHRAVSAFASDPTSVTAIDRLQSVVGLVEIGITTVKRISARLRPATLDHLGLAEAVRWEAQTFSARTGIRCHVRSTRRQTRLGAEQQTALFRIVQEALNNVVCHASASSVRISIAESDRGVDVRVRDNGRGISADDVAAPGSLGLLGMRERAAGIGGSFKVSGRRGSGTVVSVHVPLGDRTAENRPRAEAESKFG